MVKIYPPNLEELKGRREHVPASEIKFFEIASNLSDEWYVWHSVRWDKDTKMVSGEADYLLFNSTLGFIVIEVKGGIISIKDGIFYTTNTRTRKIYPLGKDPFDQAEKSMHHIRNFYIERAKLEPKPEELLKNRGLFYLICFYMINLIVCVGFFHTFLIFQLYYNSIFKNSFKLYII